METKANKSALNGVEIGLGNKPSFQELETILSGYTKKIEQQVASQNLHLSAKVDKIELKDVYSSLSIITKETQKLREIEESAFESKQLIKDLKRDNKELRQRVKELDSTSAKKEQVKEELNRSMTKAVDYCGNQTILKSNEVLDHVEQVHEKLLKEAETKISVSEFTKVIPNLMSKDEAETFVVSKVGNLKAEFESFKKVVLDEVLNNLDLKADKDAVKSLIEKKLDRDVFAENIDHKIDSLEFDEKEI
eukprot:maker-scaffold_27-snap-gene-3.4-mRNA-1 protein AED:0.47 eAED:0.47 QI:0/1/0.5/1/0/0/2/1064/248